MRIITQFSFLLLIWLFGRTTQIAGTIRVMSFRLVVAAQPHFVLRVHSQLLCSLYNEYCTVRILLTRHESRIKASRQVVSDTSLVVLYMQVIWPHKTANSQSNQCPSCIFDFRVDLPSRLLICPHRLASIMTPLWLAHGPVISESLIGLRVSSGALSWWRRGRSSLFRLLCISCSPLTVFDVAYCQNDEWYRK